MSTENPTVEEFGRWLAAREQVALDAMQTATGNEFIRHLDDFTACTAAHRVVLMFEREVCGTQGRTV
ncbi:MAG: hypothetical protein KKG12_09060 [Gammaproteobacteria bacterium]|nr:hypothetical protein [Gammaproteobacteria bacterium]